MAAYKGLETATSLVVAYESLAMAHKKAWESEQYRAESQSTDPLQWTNYNNAFALLILNASIIEGTLRSILAHKLRDDISEAVERGMAAGQTAPSKMEQLLAKFNAEVEMAGGWESLKRQIELYTDISVDKSVTAEAKEAITVMFALRNVLAHGTAIIQPSLKMSDDMKDVYPWNWQAKLHGVAMYLERHFKKGGVFENLADHGMPEHFWNVTKDYLAQIETLFTPLPASVQRTIKMQKSLGFGFRKYS
ncbi:MULTISPECIES: hypothetical protein [Pseudomonas]|uniref:hypothetical protein n=1 Tax=Pseudomonas TaxID=286 RepID=UPI000CF6091A|nr:MULTISPECIES: hypothetical protein [Pseudomonas]AVJ40011.1 hypothetical protein CLM75_22715 [Pseudomonas lurida]PRA16326.1 hypothetical protein CQ002_13995 [Pseudomonas sp. MYb13]PRA22200.1 hypothetical protein CQ004_13250 [Pseudomonas lurida]PRA34410.1 hypothetical protein CQ005_17420 [Pseudomonas lurida]PRC00606.1 hypothetical protein CQ014_16505 [Pseudomonas lurida]